MFSQVQARLHQVFQNVISVRLFYRLSRSPLGEYLNKRYEVVLANNYVILIVLPPFLTAGDIPTTAIPCRYIANRATDDWDYAICIVSN